MPVEPDFLAILEILDRHEVEFVICGGIAAILHGAPIMTADLDVVYAATEENCRRLLAAGRSEIVELEGTKVRVLGLEAIIESKEAAGRPKDLATLPLLKALARWEDES